MNELLLKSSPITALPNVREKRAKLYEKLGVETVGELIEYFPRGYIDYSAPVFLKDSVGGEPCVIKGLVTKKFPAARIRQGLILYKLTVQDDSGTVSVTFYNNRYSHDALVTGEEYLFYGRVTGGFTRKELNSPLFIRADSKYKVRPKYRLTEGITLNMLISNMDYALGNLDPACFKDSLPDALKNYYRLADYEYAIKNIHFPENDEALERSKKRLAFDELLILQLGLKLLRAQTRDSVSFEMKPQAQALETFYSSLPFELTGAQKRAVSEISEDMCKKIPMNRLLQGDVGSGKTAVAAGAMVIAFKNGLQSAMMAPTEILARQHEKTLKAFLNPLGITVCCITGATKAKERRETEEKIRRGDYHVITGTHALFSETTVFKNLGLVVTDEQHRFGVNQRASFALKGENPHRLVMSATPIPRTLAMIIYGELDITVLNEMPKGRPVTETFAVTQKLRNRAYEFIKKQLDEGRQAYIICPMIEENAGETAAAKSYYESLAGGFFREYRVGLLHGKMGASAKDKTMNSFKAREYDLLVATTVVEVGVDVPNASVILIENSDRFGLSQLHQLRGRVGRGMHKSYCILIAGTVTDETRARLKILTEQKDGFKIAEYDLKLRGAGDFFGERQHGLPNLKIADIAADKELLAHTTQAAARLIQNSADLSLYPGLKQKVLLMFEESACLNN